LPICVRTGDCTGRGRSKLVMWCATIRKSADIVVYMNAPVYVSFGALI
jgi:hypothetical protein